MRNDPVRITRQKRTKIVPFRTAEELEFDQEQRRILLLLADLLEYPADSWAGTFNEMSALCGANTVGWAGQFREFSEAIEDKSLLELQEIYTRSFDLNPVCALEIGYHLFGEDYKRGEFLARLRESENEYELGQEKQLPDYLPVVLRLMCAADDPEFRAAMVGYCLIPALSRMNEKFEKKKSPFGKLILLLEDLLKEIAEESVALGGSVREARYQHV